MDVDPAGVRNGSLRPQIVVRNTGRRRKSAESGKKISTRRGAFAILAGLILAAKAGKKMLRLLHGGSLCGIVAFLVKLRHVKVNGKGQREGWVAERIVVVRPIYRDMTTTIDR
jgi:hypothetical protein